MKIIKKVKEMQNYANQLRRQGKTISLVPTMGFLHEGHLSLIRQARKRADIVIISIFVNPTQFGMGEDYQVYPTDLEGDTKKAKQVEVDIIFIPSAKEMYPQGYSTFVNVPKITEKLCGAFRPGHFRGVSTVVTKLFNIIKPHIAIFGQKDFQQLMIIKKMVADLNMDIEIIGMPIIREEDGLAMSSRNSYLNDEERKSALSLNKSLKMAEKTIAAGERDSRKILQKIKKIIENEKHTTIDYIAICDPETFEGKDIIKGKTLIALAVKVEKTRLIDNILLE